ncbi:MAG: hypothetical protein MZU97_23455 [Bacillus subtilis]|nr:hypothetical protein [Bacillus subtilis]
MESSPISIPFGGVVDYSNGQRFGISAMSMLQYAYEYGDNPATTSIVETDFLMEYFIKVREFETIETIESK